MTEPTDYSPPQHVHREYGGSLTDHGMLTGQQPSSAEVREMSARLSERTLTPEENLMRAVLEMALHDVTSTVRGDLAGHLRDDAWSWMCREQEGVAAFATICRHFGLHSGCVRRAVEVACADGRRISLTMVALEGQDTRKAAGDADS